MKRPDYETTTHSFVVKIWLEEAATTRQPAMWRGHVTHVTSHEQQYIQSLNDLSVFVSRYLNQLGVSPGWRWRFGPLGRFCQRFCPVKR